MDFIKFIIFWICSLFRSRPRATQLAPIRPIALEFSAFRKLPPELLLCIDSFLPPESALSFSLCCQYIYFTIGKQYLDTLKENSTRSGDRYKFLKLLERDLPDHILCYYCEKFHAIKEAHRYIYDAEYHYRDQNCRPCWKSENRAYAGIYIHSNFCFNLFQMAMKRYRQGLVPPALLTLLTFPTTTSFQPDYTMQCSSSIRIVDGSMLFRQQKILLIPATLPIPATRTSDLLICPHIYIYSHYSKKKLLPRLQLLDWTGSRRYRRGDGYRKCGYCVTEFRIDFKAAGDRTTIMFVTKWMDLGQGCSPIGWNWQSHVSYPPYSSTVPAARFKLGSVCARFERKGHFEFKFDSLLTPKDKLALFEKSPYSWPEFGSAGAIVFR